MGFFFFKLNFIIEFQTVPVHIWHLQLVFSKRHNFFIRKPFLEPFFLNGLCFRIFPLEQLVSTFLSLSFKKIESACPVILNNTNDFQWLCCYMVNLLRSKGIYRIALGKESKPTIVDETTK